MGIRKRGNHYVIDYYWNGERYREAVGPSKKEAEAALGKITAHPRHNRPAALRRHLQSGIGVSQRNAEQGGRLGVPGEEPGRECKAPPRVQRTNPVPQRR